VHVNRSDARTATVSSAVFNLVSTIIGGGILSLPFAFDKCGLVVALAFMIVSAAASTFSLYVIVSCSRRGRAATYEEVVRKALGPRAGLVTVVLLVLLTFLTLVAYVILIKDLVGALGAQFLYGRAISVTEKNVLTVVCVLLVSPVLFARSMNSLRFTSVFSLVAVLVLAIAITVRAIGALEHDGEYSSDNADVVTPVNADVPVKLFPTRWQDPVYAFPIISVSFLCHFNVLPVYRELHKPTRHRLKKIVASTMFSTWVFYMIVGTMGYLFAYQMPGGVQGDILNNFSDSDKLVNLGRLGLLVTILLSLPLITQPCRRNITRLGTYLQDYLAERSRRREQKDEQEPLLTAVEEAFSTLDESESPQSVSSSSRRSSAQHVMLTLAIITVAIALALVSPGVVVVWNLMGSTVGLLVSYVLPCVSYICIRKNKPHTDHRKLTAWIILVVSSVVCLACTAQAFVSIATV
jgi:amino acid permease